MNVREGFRVSCESRQHEKECHKDTINIPPSSHHPMYNNVIYTWQKREIELGSGPSSIICQLTKHLLSSMQQCLTKCLVIFSRWILIKNASVFHKELCSTPSSVSPSIQSQIWNVLIDNGNWQGPSRWQHRHVRLIGIRISQHRHLMLKIKLEYGQILIEIYNAKKQI